MHPDEALVQGNGQDAFFTQRCEVVFVFWMKWLLDAVHLQQGEGVQSTACPVEADATEGAVGVHTQGEIAGRVALSHGVQHGQLVFPIVGADFAFERGESLVDEVVKLPEHVLDRAHPHQTVDVNSLLAEGKGRLGDHASTSTVQIPSSHLHGETNGGTRCGHSHGVQTSTGGHPFQGRHSHFRGFGGKSYNQAAFSYTDPPLGVLRHQKPRWLFRQCVP